MKLNDLTGIGLAEELAEKVLEMVKTEISGNYIPKSRFDEVNEEKKNAETLIKERDKQIEEIKKQAGDSEKLQQQIEDLQKANKDAQKEYEKNIAQMKIDNAVAKAISDANGLNEKAIKALLNLEGAKLAEDGTVEGLDKQLEALIVAEDSAMLFGSKQIKGLNPVPGGDGQLPDVSKMTYDQLVEYMANNPDVKL